MLARIITQNGNRVFEIDGKPYLPAAFRSFRPTPANVSLFYRCGIRLFQMQCTGLNSTLGLPYSNYGAVWMGDHKYDFSALDRQMSMFMKYAPDGYFMMMVQLDMPEWWRNAHNCPWYSYTHLGEALYREDWLRDASDFLQAFIEYAETTYGDRIFAYSFSAGEATEWFDRRFDGISDAKAQAYRESIGNPGAAVPTVGEIYDTSLPTLYSEDSPVYPYWRYCSGLTPERILRFASAAQEILQHRKILGLFFGYTDLPRHWQNQTGTNGYETVWASPDIDMFFSPAAYGPNRLPEGSSSYQYLVDSLAVHNKLYLHEIDHRTHLSYYPLDNFSMLGCDYETEEETIAILRRELCAAAVKDGALWWFDFMGGYYASPGMEAELRHEMAILETLYRLPHRSAAEIAVFADPMSFLHMKDSTMLPQDLVRHNRDSLHQCGAPYDYFNLNDITRVDMSRYKLCVFLNTVEMRPEVKQFLREHRKDTCKVWVYAPNYFTGGAEEVCSVRLRETDRPELSEANIVYGTTTFGFSEPTAPMFAVDDPDAEVFASYEDGTPACARKGTDFYLAAGNVPALLWHDLTSQAGVHLYTDIPGSLYADSRFVAFQTVHATEITLHLPFDCTVEELFDGGLYRTEQKRLRYRSEKGAPKLFLIRERH